MLRSMLAAVLALCSMEAVSATPSWLSPQLREHPLAGVIVDAQGHPVATDDVLAAVARARFVLVGEKHDNADHHAIEQRLIQHRLASQPGSAIVFEMLDDAQAPGLAGLAAGDDLETIRSKLAWPASGWDLAVYGPLFQASLADGTLVAGNIGKPLIRALYGQGEPLLADDPRFRTVAPASAATRAHHLERIFEAHCQMTGRDTLGPMVSIQLAKDASMASAMAGHAPALLVAGGEHARADTGVPSHLRARESQASPLVIQLLEVDADQREAKAGISDAGPADYYWFTPAAEAKDNCAAVKGRAKG